MEVYDMSPQEVDELMEKRKFTLGAKTGSGIRMYTYTNRMKTPRVLVEVIPERDEFRIIYWNSHSINKVITPWCSSIGNKEHFRKVFNGVKKWALKIEELYEEE